MLHFKFYIFENPSNKKIYRKGKNYNNKVKQLYDKSKIKNLISVELARKKGQLLIINKYTSASLVFPFN